MKTTHIHLKIEDGTIQVYYVNESLHMEERVTHTPAEMNMCMPTSRAIIYVKTKHVDLLLMSNIISTVISSELDGVTSAVLNSLIHYHFDNVDDVYFKLHIPFGR